MSRYQQWGHYHNMNHYSSKTVKAPTGRATGDSDHDNARVIRETM